MIPLYGACIGKEVYVLIRLNRFPLPRRYSPGSTFYSAATTAVPAVRVAHQPDKASFSALAAQLLERWIHLPRGVLFRFKI